VNLRAPLLEAGRRTHALALRELPLQTLNRLRLCERQTRSKRLGGRKLLPSAREISLARIDLSSDVVRLSTLRMMLEHLVDHRVSLIEMTGLYSLVDLVRRGIGLSQHGSRNPQRENQNE
jgi:hypothetical protein